MDRREMFGLVGAGFASMFGFEALAPAAPVVSTNPRITAILQRFEKIAESEGVENTKDIYHPNFVEDVESVVRDLDAKRLPMETGEDYPTEVDDYICAKFKQFLAAVRNGFVRDPDIRFKPGVCR